MATLGWKNGPADRIVCGRPRIDERVDQANVITAIADRRWPRRTHDPDRHVPSYG